MSNAMDKRKLQALANELAKDVKTPEDLSTLSAFLTKLTVEAALDYHLGYEKFYPSGHCCNGLSLGKR